MKRNRIFPLLAVIFAFSTLPPGSAAQGGRQRVRTVSIPISIFTREELRKDQTQELINVDRLIVREDGDEQQILSIRSVENAPLALAVLIQEDLDSSFNLQLRDIGRFIRNLPQGSRVMVAYLRGGVLDVRQRFTEDRESAASALRIVTSRASAAPRNPYDGLIDALNRFDALPAGRRAVLMVSDGLDVSAGLASASPGQSTDLERAILRAQRKSVSVFSIFVPATFTERDNGTLTLFGQSSLAKLSEETGGRAFYQGTIAPISFDPFFKDLNILLNRQFLLTYLSTHMKKGYHKIEVESTNPEVKVEHPKGYFYR